jgi:ABC-type Na+ efflux pump permease subunit
MAGLIGAVLTFTPLAVFGLSMLMSGAVAVYLYRHRNPWANITAGSGAKLGIATGFFASVIFGWAAAVLVLVFHAGGQVRAVIIQALDQSAARNPDPEAQQVFQYLKSPQGLVTAGICFAIFLFVFFVVLAGAGGAMGAVMARRREGR